MSMNNKEVENMTTKAQKWGNSIGVRIPQKIAKKYGIENGTEITFEEVDGGILLKPVESKPTLEELLAQCEGENPHPEYFAIPMGREEI